MWCYDAHAAPDEAMSSFCIVKERKERALVRDAARSFLLSRKTIRAGRESTWKRPDRPLLAFSLALRAAAVPALSPEFSGTLARIFSVAFRMPAGRGERFVSSTATSLLASRCLVVCLTY